MPITTKRSGPPVKFDATKAAKVIAAYVPGAIMRRTDRGIDATGAPFAPYTADYRDTLAAMKEDTKVDLRLTGGLMGSIKARQTVITAHGLAVTIAPDTGTSPQVVASGGKAKRTGQRGPQHNILGWWLHHGTPKMRARPFMGLTPDEISTLNKLIAKAGVWTS